MNTNFTWNNSGNNGEKNYPEIRNGGFEGMNQGGSGQNWRNGDNGGKRDWRNQCDDGVKGGNGLGYQNEYFGGMNQGGSGQNWRNSDNGGERDLRNQGDSGGRGGNGFGNQNEFFGGKNHYRDRLEQENRNFGSNQERSIQAHLNSKFHGNYHRNGFDFENLCNYNGGIPQFRGFSDQPVFSPTPYNNNAGRNGSSNGQRFPRRFDRNNGGNDVGFTFRNDDYHNEQSTSVRYSPLFEKLLRVTSENNGGLDKRQSHENYNWHQQHSGFNQLFSDNPPPFSLLVDQNLPLKRINDHNGDDFMNTKRGGGTSGSGSSHGGQNSHASSSPELATNNTEFEKREANQKSNSDHLQPINKQQVCLQAFNGFNNQLSYISNRGRERNDGNWQNFQNDTNRNNQGGGNEMGPTSAPSSSEKIQNAGKRMKEENPELYAAQAKNRKQVVQEKREKNDQVKAERETHRNQWPVIRCNYEPEVWNDSYLELHDENLQLSIKKLQEIKEISEEEAERVLMKTLEKTTFVELNLMINGPQTAQKLFENLKLAMGEGQENNMAFESVEQLEAFLNAMSPVFLLKKTTNSYVCSGMQSRKFCQWLLQRIKLGDIIKEENFDEDYELFKGTIGTIHPLSRALQKFTEAELTLDFSSYRYLAAVVPAFRYDKENDVFSLNSAPLPWTLQLPIFGDTMHASNPRKCDFSRKITTIVNQYAVMFRKSAQGCGVLGPLEGVNMCTFRNKFMGPAGLNNIQNMNKLAQVVTGYVQPNSTHNQIEVYVVEPIRIDFANNVVANGRHVDDQGSKFDVDFNSFRIVQAHANGKLMRRDQE